MMKKMHKIGAKMKEKAAEGLIIVVTFMICLFFGFIFRKS